MRMLPRQSGEVYPYSGTVLEKEARWLENTHKTILQGVEVRQRFMREYGLELMESGRVVLLCPNCHWRYDHGGSTAASYALLIF